MGLKGMIETGAMIIIGIIALKAFGGIQGITEFIGGIGDLFGTGNGTAVAAPATPIIPVAELPAGSTVDIIQPSEPDQPPISPLGLIIPPIGVSEIIDFLNPPPPTVTHIDIGGNGEYTPSPTEPTPISPDPTAPIEPIVWIQPPSMVGDPDRPEGAFGGR